MPKPGASVSQKKLRARWSASSSAPPQQLVGAASGRGVAPRGAAEQAGRHADRPARDDRAPAAAQHDDDHRREQQRHQHRHRGDEAERHVLGHGRAAAIAGPLIGAALAAARRGAPVAAVQARPRHSLQPRLFRCWRHCCLTENTSCQPRRLQRPAARPAGGRPRQYYACVIAGLSSSSAPHPRPPAPALATSRAAASVPSSDRGAPISLAPCLSDLSH